VDGAPAVSGVTFFPSSLIAPPKFYGNELPNGAILPSTVFARWDDLSTPFQGTVLLGYVQFVTPSTVQAGQHYNIVFHDAGGAFVDPNTDVLTGYLFDGIHGEVWPWQAAPDASSTNVRISDDWKTHFFGSMSAPDANPNDDPDGDGFTNIEEYLAGSDPNTPDWHVKSDNGHVSFRWVGRQGQNYTVQRTSDFISWTTVSGRMTGRDAFLEYDEPTTPGKAQFYRLNLQ
jgi:hypothetical protein